MQYSLIMSGFDQIICNLYCSVNPSFTLLAGKKRKENRMKVSVAPYITFDFDQVYTNFVVFSCVSSNDYQCNFFM